MVRRVMRENDTNGRARNQRTSRVRWHWAAALLSRGYRRRHVTASFSMSVQT